VVSFPQVIFQSASKNTMVEQRGRIAIGDLGIMNKPKF